MSEESEFFHMPDEEERQVPKSNKVRTIDEYGLSTDKSIELDHDSGIYITRGYIGCSHKIYNPYMSPRSQRRSKTR